MKLSTKTKYENYRQKLNPWNQPMRLIGDKGKREKRKKLMEFCQKWVNLALFMNIKYPTFQKSPIVQN